MAKEKASFSLFLLSFYKEVLSLKIPCELSELSLKRNLEELHHLGIAGLKSQDGEAYQFDWDRLNSVQSLSDYVELILKDEEELLGKRPFFYLGKTPQLRCLKCLDFRPHDVGICFTCGFSLIRPSKEESQCDVVTETDFITTDQYDFVIQFLDPFLDLTLTILQGQVLASHIGKAGAEVIQRRARDHGLSLLVRPSRAFSELGASFLKGRELRSQMLQVFRKRAWFKFIAPSLSQGNSLNLTKMRGEFLRIFWDAENTPHAAKPQHQDGDRHPSQDRWRDPFQIQFQLQFQRWLGLAQTITGICQRSAPQRSDWIAFNHSLSHFVEIFFEFRRLAEIIKPLLSHPQELAIQVSKSMILIQESLDTFERSERTIRNYRESA